MNVTNDTVAAAKASWESDWQKQRETEWVIAKLNRKVMLFGYLGLLKIKAETLKPQVAI